MLTGVREAVRVLRMLKGDTEEEANAAAGAVDAALPSRKRKQVCAVLCVNPCSSVYTTKTRTTTEGLSHCQQLHQVKHVCSTN